MPHRRCATRRGQKPGQERLRRSRDHVWDPRNQRPELWNLFNTRVQAGESIRVFPLSNWTELDVWQYVRFENIPVVPLYFAKVRPVVRRNDNWIVVDDDRLPLEPSERPQMRLCSIPHARLLSLDRRNRIHAATVDDVVAEMKEAPKPRSCQGRLIQQRRNVVDGKEETGGLLLMRTMFASGPDEAGVTKKTCCASSPAARSTTANQH